MFWGWLTLSLKALTLCTTLHCDIFRFELELKPTGEVDQYSASITHELQREAGDLVDILTFVTQTEGKYLERAPPSLPQSQVQDSQGGLINLMYLTNLLNA